MTTPISMGNHGGTVTSCSPYAYPGFAEICIFHRTWSTVALGTYELAFLINKKKLFHRDPIRWAPMVALSIGVAKPSAPLFISMSRAAIGKVLCRIHSKGGHSSRTGRMHSLIAA